MRQEEFQQHIDYYKIYNHSSFSKLVSPFLWGDEKAATDFLNKFWLPEKEYLKFYNTIKESIFIAESGNINFKISPHLETIVLKGGNLFTQSEFLNLKKAIVGAKDKFIIVIQATQNYTLGEPIFRLRFPVNITWDELISGNYISAVLLEMGYNEYFVFGDSGKWGKFAATDEIIPIDIFCFKKELSPDFYKYFDGKCVSPELISIAKKYIV